MLKNAPTLAIGGVDTAKNGPSKIRQVTNNICRNIGSKERVAVTIEKRITEIPKPFGAELKGSIGEGPNHSNDSNDSNRSNSFKIGILSRKFKNFRTFQHFLNYRRNSDKISSKSEQKSVKRIQK